MNTILALPVKAEAVQIPFAPVSGQVTSNFGWRTDPLGGGNRFHAGLDIAAPQGTPIYAPQNGRVVFSGIYKGYGNAVVVDHGYGLYTLYGHTSALYVKNGDPIYRGQPLAAVGTTGRSTGPHLHFEVHQNGKYVNPVDYLAYLGRSGMTLASSPYAIGAPQAQSSGPIEITTSAQNTYLTALNQESEGTSDEASEVTSSENKSKAMGGPLVLGRPTQGVNIDLGGAVVGTAKVTTRTVKTITKPAAYVGKRVGGYLLSSAAQAVTGKRPSWRRF